MAARDEVLVLGIGFMMILICFGCDAGDDNDDGNGDDYYPYADEGNSIIPQGGYLVTAEQGGVGEPGRFGGLPVAVVVEIHDNVARTSGVLGGGVVRWDEALLRGSADLLATTWDVKIVVQGPRRDVVMDSCTVDVTGEMITDWGGFEIASCGGTSNLAFYFSTAPQRLL